MSPNNLVMTMMGVGLLWVGWFGFNAGSSVSSGLVTAQALTVTQVSAASGALTWVMIELLRQGKSTALGFASGVLAGLVAITPAAGVVRPAGALILGAIASICCYQAILLKDRLGYDDSLDAFGVHGIGGIVGAVMLTFFIRKSWMANAASAAGGSWTVVQQLGVQITAVAIAVVCAAVGTFVIVLVVEKMVGFRANEVHEMAGLDRICHGEYGYGMLNPGR
jgi:Amt family ammonium transporter